MKKRFTFLFAALFVVNCLWAQQFQSGDLWYSITGDGNAVEVIGEENEDLAEVVIPEAVLYNGVDYKVTGIGESAFSYCGFSSITIPNSVTSIGDDAFEYCYNLTSVAIPKGVTSLGIGVFSGCESLTTVIVEEGNTVYDSRDNCNGIIETESNTIIQGCKTTVIPNDVTSIGDWSFSSCYCLTTIEIPNSVTYIGDGAFMYCEDLVSITIPNSVTSIGARTFGYCI